MNKYSEIEIETAKRLLGKGYKWIARDESGSLFAYTDKPKNWGDLWWTCGRTGYVCEKFLPIFQSVRSDDKEPVSLESVVHPQILDDAEKRYLKGVIRPFRYRVEYIKKIDCACEEYIHIQLNNDWTILPHFRTGTMYKGMKHDHAYTLEELGL